MDSLTGYAVGTILNPDPPPLELSDSLTGYAVGVITDPEPPGDLGIRVHTPDGLTPARIRTWNGADWT